MKRLVPWARAIDSVMYGDGDGIPLLMKKKERESFLKYTDPVVENRELLYYLPERLGEFQWDESTDLKGYAIGLVRGYAYDNSIMKTIKDHNIQVTYAKDSKLNLGMLQAGRVDLIVEDESVLQAILAAQPDWDKRVLPTSKVISSYYWYIGIAKHSPLVDHVGDMNRVLEEMRKDGSLKAILDKR